MSRFIIGVCLVLLLAACSGGKDSGPRGDARKEPTRLAFPFDGTRNVRCLVGCPPRGLPEQPDNTRQMPIYEYQQSLFVGIEQGVAIASNQRLGELPIVGERSNFDIRYGALDDGVGAANVQEYLATCDPSVCDSTKGIGRFSSKPTVRVVGEMANDSDVALINRAIRLVNTALPYEWKLGDAVREQAGTDGQVGTIDIEVVPESQIGGAGETRYRMATDRQSIVGANVRLNGDNYTIAGDALAIAVVAHELIHALGMQGHVRPGVDWTLMTLGGPTATKGHHLPSLDREALRARYSHLAVGDRPSDLGAWASTAIHLHGNGSDVGFGVALRNGYAEPWAYGYLPEQDLADNPALTGNATWNGTLLGLTLDAEAVAGDAAIGVDIGTLAGRADFTALESWTAGAAPGEVGTGTMWGDGDLGYSIAVRGNTFKQTGGDDGILTGIFTGESHEGAAGTLERTDLTAAFGATRQ